MNATKKNTKNPQKTICKFLVSVLALHGLILDMRFQYASNGLPLREWLLAFPCPRAATGQWLPIIEAKIQRNCGLLLCSVAEGELIFCDENLKSATVGPQAMAWSARWWPSGQISMNRVGGEPQLMEDVFVYYTRSLRMYIFCVSSRHRPSPLTPKVLVLMAQGLAPTSSPISKSRKKAMGGARYCCACTT